MKVLIKLSFLVISFQILTSFASASDSCLNKARTQYDMNVCTNVDFKEAEQELNRVYRLIEKSYQKNNEFLTKLKNSQQAWIKHRDADFGLKFPASDSRYYGSVFPMCADSFIRNLTLQRVVFLKRWLSGTEEGDVCSGSVEIRYKD